MVAAFDPLSPSQATTSKLPDQSSFGTLTRERAFRHPNAEGPDFQKLEELVRPHIESFDALVGGEDDPVGLLQLGVDDIGEKVVFDGKPTENMPFGSKITYRISHVALGKPLVSDRDKTAVERRIFPSEARERLTTYRSRLTVTIKWKVTTDAGSTREYDEIRECGLLPVMVKSQRCNLNGMSSAELVRRGEESSSWGGYFIVNGNEKLIRYLILPRRHYPINLERPSFAKRGVGYTKYGCQIRCVRPDQSACTNTIHYLSSGGATLRFAWRKVEYMIPLVLILKALVDASDLEIFEGIVQGEYDNTFLTDRVELLLRGQKTWGLHTGAQCLEYLGDKFRVVMNCPEDWTNTQVGGYLLKKVVLVNLPTPREKFRMLLFMLRKLYSMVAGTSCPDNPDSHQLHEVLLPGFLYAMIIKERFEESLLAVRNQIMQDIRQGKTKDFASPKYFPSVLAKVNFDVGAKLSYFLATGNLVSPTGLDLQQTSGFTIVAEKLNFYRYLSHFRCIHRGAFFAELKTTAVRKLLPESWGFLCPVHTPDGSPCGLLNHLSHTCLLVTKPLDTSQLPSLLSEHGMSQVFASAIDGKRYVAVQLDGRVIGWATPAVVAQMATMLRRLKTEGDSRVPLDLEIGHVPVTKGGQYPGLYLFASRSRMMRPVTYLANNKLDHIGSFEQVYMDIAVTPEEVEKNATTHLELDPTSMLSVVANMTPFSDFNQSPRNMYQCMSADHEVLTRDGWKSITKTTIADSVLVFNPQTQAQEWQQVQQTLNEAYDGVFYRLKSGSVDAVVTPEHRWLVNSKDTPGNWSFITTADAAEDQGLDRNLSIPVVGTNNNALYQFPELAFLSEKVRTNEADNLDFCRLIGLILGDGCIKREGHEDFSTLLSTQQKGLEYIEQLVARLAVADSATFTHSTAAANNDKKMYRFAGNALYDFFQPMVTGVVGYNPLSTADIKAYDQSEMYRKVHSGEAVECAMTTPMLEGEWKDMRRWLFYAWRLLLSRSQARALIEGFMVANGQMSDVVDARGGSPTGLIHQGRVRGSSSSLPLVNDLVNLALLAEGHPTVAVEHDEGKAAASWSITVSFQTDELLAPVPKPAVYENPAHDGRKYCLTVPAGNFMARRKMLYGENDVTGLSPYFTGNCQMGKQSMGTPSTAIARRTDNKMYRLQSGQTPIVRPKLWNDYGFDQFPNSTNAVVAVISYTGYDMEDAMILNKSAHERGFGYGTVYKSDIFDLKDMARSKTAKPTLHFGFGRDVKDNSPWREFVDKDGLPIVGTRVKSGDPLAAYVDDVTGKTKLHKYKGDETAFVDTVRVLGSDLGDSELQKIQITLRIPRSPVIGDKFSSRHGQKGVCSQKFPMIDMPFSESGMQPDVIINPHAFPSRMTIGMLVEFLAGKSGALHGMAQDGTPFKFSDDDRPVEYFGEQLLKAGYNYHGNEAMYSGITGEELRADIYIGVCAYQRLRHMVNDKFQARAGPGGPVDQLTRQPIKGRKRGGGVRFGEMERDALIAHGTSFLLQDRLMNCSDYSTAWVCRGCGSLISLGFDDSVGPNEGKLQQYCRICERHEQPGALDGAVQPKGVGVVAKAAASQPSTPASKMDVIAVPYVFRYLCAEMACMGIRLNLTVV